MRGNSVPAAARNASPQVKDSLMSRPSVDELERTVVTLAHVETIRAELMNRIAVIERAERSNGQPCKIIPFRGSGER